MSHTVTSVTVGSALGIAAPAGKACWQELNPAVVEHHGAPAVGTVVDKATIPGRLIAVLVSRQQQLNAITFVYNANQASESGALLFRYVAFNAAQGNHDSALRNFTTYPDALAQARLPASGH